MWKIFSITTFEEFENLKLKILINRIYAVFVYYYDVHFQNIFTLI